MPTIFQIKGWKVYFFANEGSEPIHVHCQKADANGKFWILMDLHDVEAEYMYNMTSRDLKEIRKILLDHFDLIVETWNQFQQRKNG